ncbi:MAG: translocation/assembly module TamB domain-containing protein [Endomicrobiales bacterium]
MKKRKALSIILKTAAYAAGALAVLLAAALLFMQTAFFRDTVKKQLVSAVRENTAGTLRIGRLEGNFLTGAAFRDVELSVGGDGIACADRITLRYRLGALLAKRILVTELAVDGLRFAGRQGRDGVWNFQKLARPGKKRPGKKPSALEGWAVEVREFSLERGRALFVKYDPAAGEQTAAEAAAIRCALRFDIFVDGSGPRIAVTADALNLDAVTPPLGPLSIGASGLYGPTGIDLEYLTLATRYSQGRIRGSLRDLRSPVFDVLADFPAVSFNDVRVFAPGLSLKGSAEVHAAVKGPADSLSFSTRLSYEGLTVENDGTADLSLPAITVASRVRKFHPEEILPGCAGIKPEKCPAGDVNLDADIRVRGAVPAKADAGIAVTVLPSVLSGVKIERGELVVSATSGTVRVTRGSFQTSAGTITLAMEGYAGGFFDPRESAWGTATLRTGGLDLSAFAGSGLKSSLNATARAEFKRPPGKGRGMPGRVSLSLGISTSTLKGVPLDEAVFEGTLQGDVLRVGEFRLRSPGAHLDANGALSLKGPVDLSYRAVLEGPALLAAFMPELDAAGKLSLDGTLKGTLKEPRFSGELSGTGLRARALSISSLHAQVDTELRAGEPTGAVRLSASGMAVGKTAVQAATVYAAFANKTARFDASFIRDETRTVTVAGGLSGFPGGQSEITLDTLMITGGTVAWTNTQPIEVSFSRRGVSVRSFSLANGPQRVEAKGGVEYKGELGMTLRIRSADLGQIAALAGTGGGIGGVLDGGFTLSGNAAAPLVRGGITVRQGSAGGFSFDRVSSTASYAGQEARFALSFEKDLQTLVHARGSVPVELSFLRAGPRLLPGNIDVSIDGRELDLALIPLFVKEVERASGRVSVFLAFKGSARKPSLSGRVAVSGGELRIRGAGVTYSGIDGQIVMENDSLVIKRIFLRSEEGDAEISGVLRLEGLLPAGGDIAVKARRFMVMDTQLFSGLVDAAVTLTTGREGNLAGGKVTVVESQIHLPKTTRPQIEEVKVVETGGRGAEKEPVETKKQQIPLVRELVVDSELVVPGNTWIRGSGLNAEIRGKLFLTREKDGPVTISGEIVPVRGTYEFQGKVLTIDRGRLVFTGSRTLNPALDLQASTVISNITIIVMVGGTLEKPVITLRSTPPLDQSDILSYLVFGRPLNSLSETQNRLVQKAAVEAVGKLAVEGIRDFLGQELAPEVLDIYSGQQSGFTVGKYISSRVFLRYEWRFGVEESAMTQLNVQLSEHLAVNSQVGSEKTSGVDLLWTTSY